MNSPAVQFLDIGMQFGSMAALTNINLAIDEGAYAVLLGPSGGGKTTLLNILGGFLQPSTGHVRIYGNDVTDIPAAKRPTATVFQDYALFPHMNVASNVGFGLKMRKVPARERRERVAKMLDMVGLGHSSHLKVHQLSGGQRQRIALARSLVVEPGVLLLDEPLAALDRKLRREMQIELQNLQRNVGITFILVTHDQEEALSMSDRVCIMREGEIVQIGSPLDLYDRPRNRYVADFVGKSNFFDGAVERIDRQKIDIRLDCGITVGINAAPGSNEHKSGDRVCLSVRPEQMSLTRSEDQLPINCAVKIKARVMNRIFLGEQTEYLLRDERMGDFLVLSPRQNELSERPYETNETVFVAWNRDTTLVLGGE